MEFKTIAGTVQPGLTWENVRLLPSEVPTYLNALNQHHTNNTEDLSLPQRIFLDAPGRNGMTHLFNAIRNSLKLHEKSVKAGTTSAVATKRIKKDRTAHSVLTFPFAAPPRIYITNLSTAKLPKRFEKCL